MSVKDEIERRIIKWSWFISKCYNNIHQVLESNAVSPSG